MEPMSDVLVSPADDEELYPSSDGQPMAETELHADEMTDLKLMLRRRFRPDAASVYVGGNLLVYYERGNPRAVFSPDVFVVRGAPQRQYRTYKLWRDGPPPCFVLEVTSLSTCVEDRGNKRVVYEMLGVSEYFLYDPTADYLRPPLQAFRLRGGSYAPIAPDDAGRLHADSIGLAFRLDPEGLLVVTEIASGRRLLRIEEAHEQAEAERDRVRAERDQVTAERDRVRAERDQVRAERDRLEAERDEAARRARLDEDALRAAQAELERIKRSL